MYIYYVNRYGYRHSHSLWWSGRRPLLRSFALGPHTSRVVAVSVSSNTERGPCVREKFVVRGTVSGGTRRTQVAVTAAIDRSRREPIHTPARCGSRDCKAGAALSFLARCACGGSLAFVAHIFPGNASKRWNSVRSANELKCSQLFSFPTNGTRLVQLALEARFTDKYVQ